MNKIDIVMTWVDGSDPKWIESFNKYADSSGNNYINKEMYRDYDLLKYWFRGVEKFAPWVNRIHFVTCGHYPDWLNLNNPKLNFVKHSDYIDKNLLPVFSARPIELNLHKIEGLAENFIFFNDDMFFLKWTNPGFFFKKNKPCDAMIMKYISGNKGIDHTILNDLGSVNSKIRKNRFIKTKWYKLFNLNYPLKDNIKNLLLLGGTSFSGFVNYHMPQPYTKSIYKDAWKNFEDIMSSTCSTRFRNLTNVNQYLIRYWSLVTGAFNPTNMNKERKYFGLNRDNSRITKCITGQNSNIICINDEKIDDFEKVKIELKEAFETILGEKSDFEV